MSEAISGFSYVVTRMSLRSCGLRRFRAFGGSSLIIA
jgi:hypothetical protein